MTQNALEEMHSRTAIDQVTVILGYVQMSNLKGYDAKLRAGIEGLLDLARLDNQRQLIDTLEALVHEMDQERAA